MPPEQAPHSETSGLPVISHTASTASSSAFTYVEMSQSRCSTSGLRQLMVKSCTPILVTNCTRLFSGARSMA